MPIRIGIITLSGYDNYGNRLQNLALQIALEQMGFNVNTLWVDSSCKKIDETPYTIKSLNLRYVKQFLAKRITSHRKKNRQYKFKQFNDKYVKVYSIHISKDKIDKNIIDEFDYIIVGSDQVWNYQFDDVGKMFLLEDVPKQKSIGYAISIGQDTIPDELVSQYKSAVDGFKSISVREKQAAKLLYEISGKHIPIVCDPVMLLGRQDWLCFGKKVRATKQKYVLINILSQSKELIQRSLEIAKSLKFKAIIIGSLKYRKGYENDPGDFITYIDNADLVITDSFHAVTFSIIMNTPFLAIKREEPMDSRIIDLLEIMGLNKRYLETEEECNFLNVDFTTANSVIKKKRKEAIDFL